MTNIRFFMLASYDKFHCIGEFMVSYYGKHRCKQFIRGKLIRFGFKVRVGTLRLNKHYGFLSFQGKDTGFNQINARY